MRLRARKPEREEADMAEDGRIRTLPLTT